MWSRKQLGKWSRKGPRSTKEAARCGRRRIEGKKRILNQSGHRGLAEGGQGGSKWDPIWASRAARKGTREGAQEGAQERSREDKERFSCFLRKRKEEGLHGDSEKGPWKRTYREPHQGP
jgi:hypothetical protein